jgi:hypothetical protein
VRTAIIRLPSSPYEAHPPLTLDLSLRYRGPTDEDEELFEAWWWVMTVFGMSYTTRLFSSLVSYLFVGGAEVRLVRGMA